MKQTFEEADKNGDGLLNIDEIYQLLHKMNVNLPRRKVKQMFQVRAILRGERSADNLEQRSQPRIENFHLVKLNDIHLLLFISVLLFILVGVIKDYLDTSEYCYSCE